MPALKSLDFQKVKPAEREKALRLANSVAGAALESDIQVENSSNGDMDLVHTFIPGEDGPTEKIKKSSSSASIFTEEQKQQIRALLANASSVKEIENIENAVRRGIFPETLQNASNGEDEPARKKQKI